MGQRIFNLSKWRSVAEGDALFFANDRPQRTIVLHVNSPEKVQLYVVQDAEALHQNPERKADEEAGRGDEPEEQKVRPTAYAAIGKSVDGLSGRRVQFLALVEGLDTIEFAVDGAFDLVPVGGDINCHSADGLDVTTRVIAPLIFTKVWDRRPRNRQLEMIEYRQRVNQERFRQDLIAEMDRREKALDAKAEKYAQDRIKEPVAPDAGSEDGEATPSNEPGKEPAKDGGASAGGKPKPEGGTSSDVPAKRRSVAAPKMAE